MSTLGVFDAHTDIGRVSRPGAVRYDATAQEYRVTGCGPSNTHFVWKKLSGNFILSMRARFAESSLDVPRSLGWMVRQSLEPDAPRVSVDIDRSAASGVHVLQLERRDDLYITSVARFGDTLTSRELDGVTLPDSVYAGVYVCAPNDVTTDLATFDNVRITIPAEADFQPYHDYLGSNLEILDLASGRCEVVHQYEGSFQAPNWTHDGTALIYAQEGLLYRFDLATRAASVINTGFATRNNNDHVLSFDGRMMGISHHSADDNGDSIIFTLPAAGGVPRRVTPKGPSYLHGWSPDAKSLVYAGQRDSVFDVYTISVDGGDEVRLTRTGGVDDGPEYTPDGRQIYFNSARTGRMQIWRMRPDGSSQEQVTDDEYNNWFPHISPDGRWLVYIAFPPEIAADDHPFYQRVLLRLMSIDGGPARVIAYLYGGQGTINVPSWSPDGTGLAFVSNTRM